MSRDSPSRSSSAWIPNFPTLPPLRFEGDNSDYQHPVMSRGSPDITDTTLPPLRFLGDGLDHRRPIMSQAPINVIDLTEESDIPPPRLESRPTSFDISQENDDISISSTSYSSGISTPRMQDVIEVEDNSSPMPIGAENGNQSPEVEVLHSRPTNSAHGSETRRPWPRARGQGVAPYLAELRGPIADPAISFPEGPMAYFEQMFARARGRNEVRQEPYVPRTHNGRNFTLTRQPGWMPLDLEGFDHATPSVRLPGNLDFHIQGFQMEAVNRVPSLPIYKAPPSPRLGFTRSPKEDQMIICPNCEHELAVGKNEVQRQVWVSKGCGHVSRTMIMRHQSLLNSHEGVLWSVCTKQTQNEDETWC